MYRQCSEVGDHQASFGASLSPFHFATPEASNCQDLVRLLNNQDNSTEARFRGDMPPKKQRGVFDDSGGHLNEYTVGSQGYFTGSAADYSSQSYRSKIATFSSGISDAHTKPIGLQHAQFKGGDDEADYSKPLLKC